MLTPEVLEVLKRITSRAVDGLTVLELMLELAGSPCHLTEEDFLRLRDGIEELGTRLISVLNVVVFLPAELSPPRKNDWSEECAG